MKAAITFLILLCFVSLSNCQKYLDEEYIAALNETLVMCYEEDGYTVEEIVEMDALFTLK
eukprot:CAMPEP_0202971556 /NCGR_PEP_ID=MMETSP1396-20130829/28370_1 /ASSEMBLY_ACC=CAM_ASM_000872 /TAXON_ID= /ORGANISM="Pseudokeronopsis sp., Strain Brazil" /LENGTH=59 /DNA_ID=CAMNT_0049701053 /DNA_START=1 /DNA_END=180 /DNA_ORIENTATION=-